MTEYYILLQKALGIGNRKTSAILEKYGNAKAVFTVGCDDLKLSGLFSQKQIENIKNADFDYARKVLNDCKEMGITVIPANSERYPKLLLEIPDYPVVLYAKGKTELLSEPSICIVGPRKVSPYGKKAAFSLAARLSAGGFTVVSGGAVGSDTAAHLGVLAVGGNTVCVYPSGLNTDYLKTNESLRLKISENGLLISECPPNMELKAGMIPVRNRIMSGISLATVIVEAPEKSGALITADMAAEQNRDVYVVPGKLADPFYEGSNKLIIDGATALTDAKMIFDEYSARFPQKFNWENAANRHINTYLLNNFEKEKPQSVNIERKEPKEIKNKQKNVDCALSKAAQIVYNNLDKQIFSMDEIRTEELNSAQLLAAITELEIKGVIKAMPGGRYEIK